MFVINWYLEFAILFFRIWCVGLGVSLIWWIPLMSVPSVNFKMTRTCIKNPLCSFGHFSFNGSIDFYSDWMHPTKFLHSQSRGCSFWTSLGLAWMSCILFCQLRVSTWFNQPVVRVVLFEKELRFSKISVQISFGY